jgi:hypothetical protein
MSGQHWDDILSGAGFWGSPAVRLVYGPADYER